MTYVSLPPPYQVASIWRPKEKKPRSGSRLLASLPPVLFPPNALGPLASQGEQIARMHTPTAMATPVGEQSWTIMARNYG